MSLETIQMLINITLYSLVFVTGTIIGSYLNVCIYRLPHRISTAKGRSFCPNCKHTLHPPDLVPILSYLFLKRKCRYCHEPISGRYMGIELLTGLLFVLVYQQFGYSLQTLLYASTTAILIVVAMIDYDTMEINDRMHLFIAIIAIIKIAINQENILFYVIGALIVSIPLYLILILTKGGIGGGDVKLMMASGLLVGPLNIALSMIIGSITASVIAIGLLATKKKSRKDLIPFGPFLCIGIYVSMLYGNQLVSWYMKLL